MFSTTRIKREWWHKLLPVVDLTLDCVFDKQQRYCDPHPLVWAMVVSQRGAMIIQHTAAAADAITILANTKMWENTSRQSVVRHVRDIQWNTLHSGEKRCTHKLGQIHSHVVKATFATQIYSLKQKLNAPPWMMDVTRGENCDDICENWNILLCFEKMCCGESCN